MIYVNKKLPPKPTLQLPASYSQYVKGAQQLPTNNYGS